MGEILKRRYTVRGQGYKGKQITLPPEVAFVKGTPVTLLHNGFVLIVPPETKVNEKLLRRAVELPEG